MGKLKSKNRRNKFDASVSVLQSLTSVVTMSESGEMSEFAYIMELLARGKVSAMARGAVAWIPISDTTWPVSVGIPVSPGRGWDSRVYASAPASQQLQNAK